MLKKVERLFKEGNQLKKVFYKINGNTVGIQNTHGDLTATLNSHFSSFS